MVYLIFSILSSTSIFIIFRWAGNFSVNISRLISINYLVATILGFFVFVFPDFSSLQDTANWLPWSVILGTLFIVMFFLIGYSSQKAGITVTTIANKLSLVFPVLFSLFWFNEKLSVINFIGLFLSFVAIFLTIYRTENRKTNLFLFLLPVIIFLGSGITDSFIKYIQAEITNTEQVAVFTTFVFSAAFLLSVMFTLPFQNKRKEKITFPTLSLGFMLGLVNFGSLYFFISALNKSHIESSLVFAINNMSIVLLSSLVGNFVFNEKLSKLNYTGILLAMLSLYFLM